MRLASLNDLKKKEEEEEKRQEYFAGGIDQRGGGSGVAVEGPPGRGNHPLGSSPQDLFGSVIARAQRESEQAQETPAGESVERVEITFYQNGFTVNDGPLREPSLPENRTFLAFLDRGQIPPELGEGRNARLLDVVLKDKRAETWTPPPYIAFSGTANVIAAPSSSSSSSAVFSAASLASTPTPLSPEGSAATNVQVRTHDNRRLRIRIHAEATVAQLAAQIVREGGFTDNTLRFTLQAGFPPRELTDGSATISAAGLANAAVTMKKV